MTKIIHQINLTYCIYLIYFLIIIFYPCIDQLLSMKKSPLRDFIMDSMLINVSGQNNSRVITNSITD